jgi:hypothetical protein
MSPAVFNILLSADNKKISTKSLSHVNLELQFVSLIMFTGPVYTETTELRIRPLPLALPTRG